MTLIEQEVTRELADNLQRQVNAVSRASVILAAAGITGVVQVAGSSTSIWDAIVSVLAFVAAACAIVSIVFRTTKFVRMRYSTIDRWVEARPEALTERLVASKMRELVAARGDLAFKNYWLRAALVLMTLGWAIVLVQAVATLISGSGR